MRVDVYAEEMTDGVEIVEKTDDTGAHFYGVRFYLKTHEDMLSLHHADDDGSAVTFWVKSNKGGYKKGDELRLSLILGEAACLLQTCVEKDATV